jgi:hypothetical protein
MSEREEKEELVKPHNCVSSHSSMLISPRIWSRRRSGHCALQGTGRIGVSMEPGEACVNARPGRVEKPCLGSMTSGTQSRKEWKEMKMTGRQDDER